MPKYEAPRFTTGQAGGERTRGTKSRRTATRSSLQIGKTTTKKKKKKKNGENRK